MSESLGTILLAEDNDNDVLLLRLLLAKCGIWNPLQVVYDGQEAINYLKGTGKYADRELYPWPILFLLDCRMPVVNGLDVLKWMQAQPHLVLTTIVLTGASDPRQMNEAYEAGARIFQGKPLDERECHTLLRAFKGIDVTEG